jgi:hypothetical protein
MVRHYTLSPEDLTLINRRRGDPNRLGFALMLCYWVFRSMRIDIPLDLNKDSGRMGIGIPLA